MQILFSHKGAPMPKPFAPLSPLGTMVLFDQTELPLVETLLTSLIDHYDDDQIDEFYYQLRAIREDVRANIPEVLQ